MFSQKLIDTDFTDFSPHGMGITARVFVYQIPIVAAEFPNEYVRISVGVLP
jgi:hypothetical protein